MTQKYSEIKDQQTVSAMRCGDALTAARNINDDLERQIEFNNIYYALENGIF